MNNEKLESEKLDQGLESPEEKIENSIESNLEELEENSNEESSAIEKINDRLEKSSQDFQEKIVEGGALQSLSEKIKKSKLLRAGIVAFNLSNASPALASELGTMLNNADGIVGSVESSQGKSESANRFDKFDIADNHKLELKRVYNEASDDIKEVILDELESGHGVDDEEFNGGDDILIAQQQVIDSQNSGEMGARREGGVVVPFDEGHSGKTDGVEYTDDRIAENDGKQRLTIESASENQIRAWIDYLKKNSK